MWLEKRGGPQECNLGLPNIKRQGEKESFQRERREDQVEGGLSDQLLTSVAGGLSKTKAENSRA